MRPGPRCSPPAPPAGRAGAAARARATRTRPGAGPPIAKYA